MGNSRECFFECDFSRWVVYTFFILTQCAGLFPWMFVEGGCLAVCDPLSPSGQLPPPLLPFSSFHLSLFSISLFSPFFKCQPVPYPTNLLTTFLFPLFLPQSPHFQVRGMPFLFSFPIPPPKPSRSFFAFSSDVPFTADVFDQTLFPSPPTLAQPHRCFACLLLHPFSPSDGSSRALSSCYSCVDEPLLSPVWNLKLVPKHPGQCSFLLGHGSLSPPFLGCSICLRIRCPDVGLPLSTLFPPSQGDYLLFSSSSYKPFLFLLVAPFF